MTLPPKMWTADEEAILRRLWPDKEHSASSIAEIIGRSRNSIIGRAHRLGLSERPVKARYVGSLRKAVEANAAKKAARGEKPTPRFPSAPAPIQKPVVPELPSRSPVGFTLGGGCRWLEGDGLFTACGSERVTGRPYCPGHLARAYRRLDLREVSHE